MNLETREKARKFLLYLVHEARRTYKIDHAKKLAQVPKGFSQQGMQLARSSEHRALAQVSGALTPLSMLMHFQGYLEVGDNFMHGPVNALMATLESSVVANNKNPHIDITHSTMLNETLNIEEKERLYTFLMSGHMVSTPEIHAWLEKRKEKVQEDMIALVMGGATLSPRDWDSAWQDSAIQMPYMDQTDRVLKFREEDDERCMRHLPGKSLLHSTGQRGEFARDLSWANISKSSLVSQTG